MKCHLFVHVTLEASRRICNVEIVFGRERNAYSNKFLLRLLLLFNWLANLLCSFECCVPVESAMIFIKWRQSFIQIKYELLMNVTPCPQDSSMCNGYAWKTDYLMPTMNQLMWVCEIIPHLFFSYPLKYVDVLHNVRYFFINVKTIT